MDSQERIEIIDKILWGKSLVTVQDGHNNSRSIILRSLTAKENNIANYIYKRELEIAKQEGLLSLKNLQDLYSVQEIWCDKQEEQLKTLAQQVKILQSDIKDSERFPTKKKKLEQHLKLVREKIEDLNNFKFNLFIIAYENRADEVRKRFLLMMSAEDMNENPLWKDEETFLNDADSALLYNLALQYYKNNVFTEKQIREIARCGEWRYRWSVAKEGADLFGKPIADWSETQGALVYWSQYYDSIYSHHNCPNDAIINNDDSCDAWVRETNKEFGGGAKTSSSLGNKNKSKKKDGHQEQFLFVEPGNKEVIQEVQDMNIEQVRQQLQEEYEYIKKHGRVSEWKLRVARKKGEMS